MPTVGDRDTIEMGPNERPTLLPKCGCDLEAGPGCSVCNQPIPFELGPVTADMLPDGAWPNGTTVAG